jgi:photosystem II stability/assembly factor-like uncharacterized protein
MSTSATRVVLSKVKKSGLLFLCLCVTILPNAQTPTPAAQRMQRMGFLKSSWDTVAFRNIGPSIMSGRVVDVDVNGDDPAEFYVAYATGGLWHTTNNGQSFTPVFDSADVITIGDIAVNWKTRAIWVGAGEVNSSRSSYAGMGIYKSLDSGKTWRYVGLPESHHIGKIQLHPADDNTAWVAVLGHLYSPNKERGVFKTTDGGATWQHTLAIDEHTGVVDLDLNFQNPSELYAAAWQRKRTAWSFEASGQGSGIYKSEDGGNSWKKASGGASGFPDGVNVGRIGLAVYPKNPQIVYAVLDNQKAKPDTAKKDTGTFVLAELKSLAKEQFAQLNDRRLDTFLKRNALEKQYSAQALKKMVETNVVKPTDLYNYLFVNTGFENPPIGCEVYRSDNGGGSWRKVNEKEVPIFFTYGYYFSKIYVSPYNEDKVFVLGYSSQVSTNGGKTFKNMDKENVHADHHALWVNPKRDSHLINGNDGGINITYDDGAHWAKANTPAVGQFYSVTVDAAKPYNVYGGLQDNGVWWGPSTNKETTNWHSDGNYGFKPLLGGDGMQVQVDTTDNVTTYTGFQFGNYYRLNRLRPRDERKSITPQHRLGERPYRYNWQAPIVMSRHNPDILYFGSNKLFRSFKRGDTMLVLSPDLTKGDRGGNVPYGTLTAIAESPLRFGLLYTGSDDGNVHLSKDAGYTWTLISAPQKRGISLPQNLWVSRIVASQYKDGRVYLSLNGYRNDDFRPYLYMSEDYGTTWMPLGRGLPLEPVNVVREDPKQENIIYVGTDGGLYVSLDRGRNFAKWTAGLPRSVPVHDIAIQERENEIVIATHGRSIYIAKLSAVQKAARLSR